MVTRGITFLSLVLICTVNCFAEETDSLKATGTKPSVSCFQRPKFFELNYHSLPAVKNYPIENARGDEKFEANRLLEAKMNVPIVLHDKFKLISQLRYKNESLNLGENDFYEKEIKLNNTGITFLYQWFYDDESFIAGHFATAIKSDKYNFQYLSSILDYNGSVIYGKKKADQTTGVGVMFGNSLGRFHILPVLVYENQLGPNWHINAYLPKEIEITRALVPDNFYLKMAAEGSGAAYFLNENTLEEFPAVEYRRRAIDLKVGLEKEVKDWLWIGVYAGATQPLKSILVETGRPSRFAIHDFDQKLTPFADFSLFVVPPRALYNKLSK